MGNQTSSGLFLRFYPLYAETFLTGYLQYIHTSIYYGDKYLSVGDKDNVSSAHAAVWIGLTFLWCVLTSNGCCWFIPSLYGHKYLYSEHLNITTILISTISSIVKAITASSIMVSCLAGNLQVAHVHFCRCWVAIICTKEASETGWWGREMITL